MCNGNAFYRLETHAPHCRMGLQDHPTHASGVALPRKQRNARRPHGRASNAHPTPSAEGRPGDCPGPRTATNEGRHVTRAGGGGGGSDRNSPPKAHGAGGIHRGCGGGGHIWWTVTVPLLAAGATGAGADPRPTRAIPPACACGRGRHPPPSGDHHPQSVHAALPRWSIPSPCPPPLRGQCPQHNDAMLDRTRSLGPRTHTIQTPPGASSATLWESCAPKGGGGGLPFLYGPQNGCTDQWVLWAPGI